MRRTLLLVTLLLLVLCVPPLSANPGGTGDGNRDAACGGSCHGDPGLSEPSSAVLTFTTDRDSAYVGGPISVTITVTEMELSSCLLYTSPSPRDRQKSRMPSSA